MIRAFLSFDKFIFPRIARVVYFVGLFLIGISLVVGIASGAIVGAAGSGAAASLFLIAGGIISAILSAIVWRLLVELWMVAFAINDNLRAIREQGPQK
ncbi:DUF4282 domain-containing protein [Nitratireductor luteus]|uniref:DUF4282 domain-containing protein n=1 Tax=Nitratireductor luteus TaxID=2976980 RepID=UPI002240844E|nr:DUF4282 domain-containing protein [Nitratireductor luteus]